MTVRELLSRIDSRELSEWMAFYGIDPWGEERGDIRAGIIAATIVNVNGGKGKAKPSDFMPQFDQPENQPQSPEALRDIAFRANILLGGTVK